MSEMITGKTVVFRLDLDNPPPFTEEQQQQLQRLREMKDEDIDLSDIPEQSGLGNWTRPGLFGGPVGKLRREALKEKLLLLDEDVIDLFRETGDNSPDRMNAILREYAQARRKTA